MPSLLKPTLREKNRYIAFEIVSEEKHPREVIVKALWNAVLRFLGESGAGKTSLWIMDWDEEVQKGIIKVNHRETDNVKAALTLMKEIRKSDGNKNACIYRTLTVSGTLKKLREKTGLKAQPKGKKKNG
ncbi:MAG: ribonuclease P protein component 2 [Candidatus Altiarchaeota archaeon]|nr:ribonuclease P protein component 2 [Candidatus Altiarchaeota archaeon]